MVGWRSQVAVLSLAMAQPTRFNLPVRLA
jgi:hypothetical protein